MSLILLAFCGLWGITAPIHFSHPQKSAVFTPQNCPHCGQKWSARRKKAPGFSPAFSPRRPKSLDFARFGVFPHLPQAAFPAAISSCSDVFCQRSRTAAQRPVFGLPADTRSAGRRKRHKPLTRARQAGIGVLAVRSACVFNETGIFPPCGILAQFSHLPIIVLLERELNWSDCE